MSGDSILTEERKRKQRSPRLKSEIHDDEDKKFARWRDEIEDEDDAKIRETWAFQRLESFQADVFPNGFPPAIDLNTVFCELNRSQHSDPHTHPITLLWRENEGEIRAFGRVISASKKGDGIQPSGQVISESKSWREVVRGPAQLQIPAIGGEDEIMALAVLYHGCEMSEWLAKLWKPMLLGWVVYPDTHPDSPKPEFWAGVKLSRGSKYQMEWTQGHQRRLHCDISTLLGLTPARDDSSNESEAPKTNKKRKVSERKGRARKSESPPVDSDDEPLVGKGKQQHKAKKEKNTEALVRLLLELNQDWKENKAWRQEINLKLGRFQKEDRTWKQEMEHKVNKLMEDAEGLKQDGKANDEFRDEVAGQFHSLDISLHSTLGKVEVMDDGLKTLEHTMNKALAERHIPMEKVTPSSSCQETSYNTPTKTPAKGSANATDTRTRTGGLGTSASTGSTSPRKVPSNMGNTATGTGSGVPVTWATKNQPLPWEVPATRF